MSGGTKGRLRASTAKGDSREELARGGISSEAVAKAVRAKSENDDILGEGFGFFETIGDGHALWAEGRVIVKGGIGEWGVGHYGIWFVGNWAQVVVEAILRGLG